MASNGSVTFRYPPVEVRSTETFDARKIVLMLLEEVPNAAVAVEEVGVGYRLNRPFPDGEITGEMVLQSVEELVAEPVTRVIIRDPHSSEEEFLALAEKLGLQGTNYFIGWTAWLDIAPEGISKASALADVAAELGVDQADVLAIGDGRNDIEMLQLGRPRRGHGPVAAGGPGGRRRRHRDGERTTASPSSCPGGSRSSTPRAGSPGTSYAGSSPRSRPATGTPGAPCCTRTSSTSCRRPASASAAGTRSCGSTRSSPATGTCAPSGSSPTASTACCGWPPGSATPARATRSRS